MSVRARFRPHQRGFGFLTPVTSDGLTPTTVTAQDPTGTSVTLDSIFVPPAQARGLIADDLVEVEFTVADDGRAAADQVTPVSRARKILVGTVQHGAGGLILEPDSQLGTGWVTLEPSLGEKLKMSLGRQIVVLVADDEDGNPIARALVAGPHVVGSPDAIRARAVVVALGRAAPELIPGGPAAAGLDPAKAATDHIRMMGRLAGGGRGAAMGLETDGPIPGALIEPTDRRAEACVSVDSASTRDVDDAVTASWDGSPDDPVEIAVHIADVAGVVGVGSPADIYARTAASTAYLAVGANAPMLDPALSEDSLSLLPNEVRRSLSVRFGVLPDGSVDVHTVEVAWIQSDAKLTYAAVESWLSGDDGPLTDEAGQRTPAVAALLGAVREASRRLGVERDARTTLGDLFDQAEVEPCLVDGKLAVCDAEPHAAAYRLIERLMVAANEAIAGWLVTKDVPALYRAHVGLDTERHARLAAAVELAGAEVPALKAEENVDADELVGQILAEVERLDAEGRQRDRDLLVAAATTSTARAAYDPDPSHHQGLGAGAYCHFTSPIRRYADLVVHRQVRAALADETPPHGAQELSRLATWLDARAGALNHVGAFERGDLWARLLDRGFIEGAEPATVTGITNAGLKIRLPRLGLSGFVMAERALGLPAGERGTLDVDEHGLDTTSGPWRVGSQIQVRCTGLDQSGRPKFSVVDD